MYLPFIILEYSRENIQGISVTQESTLESILAFIEMLFMGKFKLHTAGGIFKICIFLYFVHSFIFEREKLSR